MIQLQSWSRLTKLIQANEDSSADVTAAVEDLLNSLSNKFAGVSSEIFAKSE
jgi:heat shock factor-binding protein 1